MCYNNVCGRLERKFIWFWNIVMEVILPLIFTNMAKYQRLLLGILWDNWVYLSLLFGYLYLIKFPVIKVRQFWQILYALAVCLLNAQLLLNEFFEMLGQLGVRWTLQITLFGCLASIGYIIFFLYFFSFYALVLVETYCFCLFNFVIIFTAAGLQVLQEKHLIHRDLKPQVLCLALF